MYFGNYKKFSLNRNGSVPSTVNTNDFSLYTTYSYESKTSNDPIQFPLHNSISHQFSNPISTFLTSHYLLQFNSIDLFQLVSFVRLCEQAPVFLFSKLTAF
ncbi:hypothetical protein QVD17_32320 [Tagetes erecta]|uniref:Uncharacterized protein n=1 Tax=Tagetes erecta TaxID=13708 RepID=A0AAD8K524_TARER|nr:hypothetical protein QVD17_32320 [Tagetes erecta]